MNNSREAIGTMAGSIDEKTSNKVDEKMIADNEFQERVAAYKDELKGFKIEQKIAYERREAEINRVLSLEKNLKLILNENEELKRKLSEQINALNKNETAYKNQLKVKSKEKLELDAQIKHLNKTIQTIRDSHAKIESELKTKCENLEKECQKSKENEIKLNSDRDEFYAKVKHDFELKMNQFKKENDRNLTHLVSQNAKSAETANILLEHEKSENKNKQAVILNLKKEINELKEYSKRFDEQNELHARKITELETLSSAESTKVSEKENTISCLRRDLNEANEKNTRLTNLNESLVLNLEMEKSFKATNEKIIEEMRLEKYELEHQLQAFQSAGKQYSQHLEYQIQSFKMNLKDMECANTQLLKQLESTHVNLAEVKNLLHTELQFRKENEKELNQIREINLNLSKRVYQLENELTDVKFKADDEKSKYKGDIETLQNSQVQLKIKFEKTTLFVENKALKEKLKQIQKERDQERNLLNQHLDEINRLKVENNNVNNFKENLKHLVLNSTNQYCKDVDTETNEKIEKIPIKVELGSFRSFSIDSHGSFQSKSQSSDNLSEINDRTNTEVQRLSFNRDKRKYDENDDEYQSEEDDRNNNQQNRAQHQVNENFRETTSVQHRISNYKGKNFIPDFNNNIKQGSRNRSRRRGRNNTSNNFRYSAYQC